MFAAVNKAKGISLPGSDHPPLFWASTRVVAKAFRPLPEEFRPTGFFRSKERFRSAKLELSYMRRPFLRRIPVEDHGLFRCKVVSEMPFRTPPMNSLSYASDRDLTCRGILNGKLAFQHIVKPVLIEK